MGAGSFSLQQMAMVRITPVAKVAGVFLIQLHGWKALFDEPVNCQQISLDK